MQDAKKPRAVSATKYAIAVLGAFEKGNVKRHSQSRALAYLQSKTDCARTAMGGVSFLMPLAQQYETLTVQNFMSFRNSLALEHRCERVERFRAATRTGSRLYSRIRAVGSSW